MLAQVRVMPNMPCLIRQAASAFVMGNHTSEQDLQRVLMLLSSVGAPLLPPACRHAVSQTCSMRLASLFQSADAKPGALQA